MLGQYEDGKVYDVDEDSIEDIVEYMVYLLPDGFWRTYTSCLRCTLTPMAKQDPFDDSFTSNADNREFQSTDTR